MRLLLHRERWAGEWAPGSHIPTLGAASAIRAAGTQRDVTRRFDRIAAEFLLRKEHDAIIDGDSERDHRCA